jgi:glc operon protein GlcG
MGPVRAVELPRQPVLTLEAARSVLAAAEAEARKQGWPGAIAVADAGGALLAMVRMDGASPAAAEIAPGKARAAAVFRRSTSAFEDAINGPRAAAITSHFVMMAAGLPLAVDGQVVDAIGVSADTPQHDVTIAEAGRNVLPN